LKEERGRQEKRSLYEESLSPKRVREKTHPMGKKEEGREGTLQGNHLEEFLGKGHILKGKVESNSRRGRKKKEGSKGERALKIF